MTDSQPWTVQRLLNWTTDYLRQQGSENARLDAEVLLAHARNCQRIELYTSFAEIPGEEIRNTFRALVKQRAGGVPVAYLVGEKEFYSLAFKVTPDVLIPRPDTESVVISLLDLVKDYPQKKALEIADVGSGSGAITVCAAKHVPQSQVTAIDLSPAALAVARENARRHKVTNQIEFIESDLFSAVPNDRQFDFIASNPPYVSEQEYEELPAEIRQQEPKLALVGGKTGKEVIERLVEQSSARLRPGGWLLMELSPMIAADVLSLLEKDGHFTDAKINSDLGGHARVAVARRR